jgi:hypothetical protein
MSLGASASNWRGFRQWHLPGFNQSSAVKRRIRSSTTSRAGIMRRFSYLLASMWGKEMLVEGGEIS